MARIKYYNQATGKWEYADDAQTAPVQSVNGKKGTVMLTAADVGAENAGTVAALESKALMKADISVKKAQLTLADGTVVLIDVLVASEGTIVETYTNQMPISIDTDKSVYNGTGWKAETRLSASSGSVKPDTNGGAITGFIPVKKGNIVRFKYTGSCKLWDTETVNAGWNTIAYYDTSFTWLGSSCPVQGSSYGICTNADYSTGSVANGGIVSFTVPANDSIAYVRLSFAISNPEDLSGLIVTVDEEIT